MADETVPPADTGDVEHEIASIEERMRTDHDGYWHDEAAQRRYGQLIEARDTGVPAPAVDAKAARRGELERMMQDGAGEY